MICKIIQLPMSNFNRIYDPVLESVALIGVKKGSIEVIEDEPERRQYKQYDSLLPVTMTEILEGMK